MKKLRDKNAKLEQALNYQYLFLEGIYFSQAAFKNDNAPPKHDIYIKYRRYALDKNNNRVYKPGKFRLNFKNNTEVEGALDTLETELIKLITSKTDMDIEKI
jgi:hypothetical protein